jgi:hypothetical protein
MLSKNNPMKNEAMQKIIAERKSKMEAWLEMSPEERRKAKIDSYMKEHDDLMNPSELTAAYICSNAGTDLGRD